MTGISYNMSRVDLSGFRTVAFDYGKIHMRGGALAKASPVDSKVITVTGDRKITFVRMATREAWLVAAVTGEKKLTGAFARTSLLDDLRLKILQYCNGEVDSSSDATCDDNTQDVEYDPMSEVAIEADPSCPPIAVRGVKRMLYKKMPHSKNACVLRCLFAAPRRTPRAQRLRRSCSS